MSLKVYLGLLQNNDFYIGRVAGVFNQTSRQKEHEFESH